MEHRLQTGSGHHAMVIFVFSAMALMSLLLLSQALSSSLVYLGIVSFAVMVLCCTFTFSLNYPFLNVLLLIFVVMVQYFVIGVGGNWVHSEHSVNELLLLLTKELVSGIAFAFLLLKKGNAVKLSLSGIAMHEWVILFFLGWVLVSFVLTDAPLNVSLAYIRNFVMLFVLYGIGRIVDLRPGNFKHYFYFLTAAMCALSFFGLIELTFFTNRFWEEVFHVSRLYMEKTGERYHELVRNGLPLMWYTVLGHFQPRRLVSFYMEPVNLSYFYVIPASLLFVKTWMSASKKPLLAALLVFNAGAFLLTFGKGGILAFAITCCATVVFLRFPDKAYWKTCGVAAFLVFLAYRGTKSFISGSADNHFVAIASVFSNVFDYPLGNGIGVGGNYSRVLGGSGVDWLGSGGESALASMTYQLGIPGLLLMTLFFMGVSFSLYKKAGRVSDPLQRAFAYMMSAAAFSLFIGSIFQENAFTPHANVLFMLSAGLAVNLVNREGERA
ncbi:hypothetical protein GE107_13775 [Cohnella sp. CFH 77786]|uniref:hypothetical protein n=1 Tax=Cohnella sp. CFH 77786 TaxID=2662265 RepID=UPI001C609149|nr:hypothetical protein [Cohnella sp. CFH 77786]MBW5447127.1 hypothetical protein [Cohnella sp. CFH 77786]